MGSGGCKIIICICGAAQQMEKGNVLLSYRVGEKETPIRQHQPLIDKIHDETIAFLDIVKTATGITIQCPDADRRKLPVLQREGYETFLANDHSFSDEQILAIINRGNTMEALGVLWNDALLRDAGWPPTG